MAKTKQEPIVVEYNAAELPEGLVLPGIAITPNIGPDYWRFRVQVSENQAVVGFPKFNTIGIGFQHEDVDWNTNLPFTCTAGEIYTHIRANRRDAKRDRCLAAIRAIQRTVQELKQPGSTQPSQP